MVNRKPVDVNFQSLHKFLESKETRKDTSAIATITIGIREGANESIGEQSKREPKKSNSKREAEQDRHHHPS